MLKFGSHKSSFLRLFVVCILWLGCYSPERSLSLDPHNKPQVHILESTYDLVTGTVIVRWEYIGSEPVTAFEVQRRIASEFEIVARIEGNRDAPNYVFVASYRDDALVAGERVFYQIVAELAGGGRELTQTANVTIPGAQAIGVVRDPLNLAVQFRWQPDPTVGQGYRVVRTIGSGAPVVIHETDDPQESSFLDGGVTSNAPHHYQVLTRTPSGFSLVSRTVTAHFYREATTQPVETVRPETELMRLSVGDISISGGTLALIARASQFSLFQFRYQIGLAFDGSPRILRTLVGIVFPRVPEFLPKSVDIAGPLGASTASIFPRVYIGGILADGQVDLVGFEMPLFNQVWSLPNVWVAPSNASHIALARDSEGRIFAAVGNVMQIFSDFGGFVGTETLQGDVKDLSIQSDQIWVVLEDGQIQKGTLRFDRGALSHITWSSVALEASVFPVALSQNSLGQTFVLDANNREILMLQPSGQIALQIGLPPGDYTSGDVVLDQASGNLVQVTDGRGDVTTFIP